MTEEFYIGQIFEDMYPKEAADWCNANNAIIAEIESVTKQVEEPYEEEIVVPDEDGEGGHVEIVQKTRMVEKTLRRFEIQEIPEPTIDELKKRVRSVRDGYISGIEWRVSRYRDQVELDITPTDTEETYHQILQYMQYLRDYPESSYYWYENNPKTFEEWQNQ